MKRSFSIIALCVALALAMTLNAQKPVKNISKVRHPNLAAAQTFARQAYEKIVEAQKVNEWDLGGHAQKAKLLLEQVNDELKLAAIASNERK
jgi:hypothetical protein